jgi:integrase
MSIYPDKKDGVVTGRWRVEVQLGSMRKRGRFDTMAEAKAAEASWQVQLASGSTEDATSRDTGTKTLLQLLAKAAPMLWNGSGGKGLSDHGELSEKKVRWIAQACGDILLAKLTTDYVDQAIIKLRAAGKAPGTINRYLSAMHKVLAWGAARGRQHVTVMPEFSWQDEDEGRIRYLSPDEETRLIATLRALGFDEAADLCIVAIDTGCRRGELLAAQPDQIDGKWLRLWQTKNGHARSVPLTSRAREILLARSPWQIKEHQLRYAWDKAKVAVGLSGDDDYVFHALRHTRATRLVELGVNLRVIQQFMGHRAIATTLRYAHVSDDMLTRVGEMMETALSGQVPPETPGGGLPQAHPIPHQSTHLHRASVEPVE